MDLAVTAIFLLGIGLAGLAMSANAVYEYGERIMSNVNSYTDLYHTSFTNGRQQAYKDQVLTNLAESIWKIRDIATENEIVQVADERGELYELLAQAAVLVDTIRARS